MSEGRQEILEGLAVVDGYLVKMFYECDGDEKKYLDLEEKISNAIEWIENLNMDCPCNKGEKPL